MPWEIDPRGDGLRATDPLPYNELMVLQRIQALQNTNINQPRRMCDEIREGLQNRHMSRSVIMRLSTWCDFSQRTAETIAREIGNLLFGRYPQPRFRDGNTLRQGAEEQYAAWIQSVVPQERPELSLSVRRHGRLLGRLRLFGSHLIWYPEGRDMGLHMNWDHFHDLMVRHARPEE